MSTLVNTVMDFGGANRATNLAPAVAAGQPVTFEQHNAALAGLSWKDDVKVSAPGNVNLAAPGASVDGVTLTLNDRVHLPNQTAPAENGLYLYNGAATPMTRAPDAATFAALHAAVVTVREGSSAGATYRQTQVGGVLETDPIIFTPFVPAAPAATETTAGVAEIATQAEVDAGTRNDVIVSPAGLANYSGRAKRYSVTIGDGTATSYTVTHNLGTDDVQAYVRETGGNKRQVLAEVQHTSVNSVTVVTDAAVALNAYRVTVIA